MGEDARRRHGRTDILTEDSPQPKGLAIFSWSEEMYSIARILTGALAVCVVFVGATTAPSVAQTTTMATSPGATSHTRAATHQRRVRRAPSTSPSSRNTGPTSSVDGGRTNNLGNANSGLPSNPRAPSASGDGSTGGGQ